MKTKIFTLLLAASASIGMMFASDTQVDGIWYDFNESSLTASVTYQGSSGDSYANEYTGDVIIPATVTFNDKTYSVTSIGPSAFSGCKNLTSVTIPNSITILRSYAFSGCNQLTSITIPSSVTKIEQDVFGSISRVNITDIAAWCNVELGGYIALSYELYYNNQLITDLIIPNGITSIKHSAFRGCSNLTSVSIPNSVTSIGSYAFFDCSSLISVNIPNSVSSIGEYAFYRCTNMSELVISYGVANIEEAAFCHCSSLTSLELPSSIVSIGRTAFSGCTSLTSVTIPNSVTNLGTYAFVNCTNLTTVTIGSGVSVISERAFLNCSSLKTIVLKRLEPPMVGEYAFNGVDLYNIFVPVGTVETYQNAPFWSDYSSKIKCSPWEYIVTTYAEHGDVILPLDVNMDTILTAVPDYGYHFVQWSDGNTDNPRAFELTQDTTFIAEFTKNVYTITYNVDSVLGRVQGNALAEFLDTVTFEAIPNYGYHFTQWSDDFTNNPRTIVIMQDTTFTAEFAKNSYHVVTQPNNAGYGSTTGDTTALYKDSIAISAEAKYGYHFVKWSDESTINQRKIELTKDTTLTAIFAPNQYTISTQAEHGSIANGGKYDYNTQVTLIANADEHYHFVRWSDGEMNATRTITVTKDTTYVAIFEIDKFLIKFKDEDGTELKSDSVEYGVLPIAPTTPTKDSTAQYAYAFDVWSPTIAVVTDNAIYTATYTATLREYLVSFLDEDSSIISSKNYQYGQTPVAPTNPVKQATAEYTYTFAGWDKPINQVQGAQTYKATYSATKNSYTITWKSDKGSTIDQTTVEYGVVPTHIDAIKAATAEYTYTFAEWTPIVVAVTGDATYTATFDSIKNSYTITWQNEDGSLIDQTTVEYGLIPAHTEPAKLPTVEYTYTFAGWTPEVVAVIGDTTYRATFTATKNTYIITWQNEYGSTIDQTTVEYGVVPTHAEPTKQATAEYTYTFAGWYPNVVAVTGDTTYIATFDSIKNSYTITWQNEDGSLIDQTTVEYGLLPAHAEPAKLPTAEYTYTFAGWSPAVVSVTGDATYRAIFTAVKNKYLIIFRDDDGTELKRDSVEYGVLPIAPTAPSKESTAQYTYTFMGWMPEVAVVTQAATYTATYTSTLRSYVVTFLNEDSSVISMQTYKYGEIPTIPETPTKQATAEYTYTFAGWTPSVATVTEDVTYTATFIATKNKYLIVFQDEDGTELKSEQVEYGEMPVAPTAPSKPADSEYIYTFSGWTPEIVVVTKDATYIAIYDATPVSEGFEDISLEGIAPRKVMIDGNVYILRGEKVYNAQGALVK